MAKVEYSVNLLRKAERLATAYDSDNGYYLAFSGGKDSQCLYHIAKLAGVQFKAHMNLTSVDPAPVIRFVKQHYPNVELIKPKMSIFDDAIKRKILPTMRVRWCCADYKEGAGAGKVTLIGIRHEESARRARRNEVEIDSRKFSGTLEELDTFREEQAHKKWRRKQAVEINITNAKGERTLGCISGKESLLISPIIHWSDADVWEFLNRMNIPHCELYDEGTKRIGCLCCPMSPLKQKLADIERFPHIKRNWIRAIKTIRRGVVFSEEYVWWNIRWSDFRAVMEQSAATLSSSSGRWLCKCSSSCPPHTNRATSSILRGRTLVCGLSKHRWVFRLLLV